MEATMYRDEERADQQGDQRTRQRHEAGETRLVVQIRISSQNNLEEDTGP